MSSPDSEGRDRAETITHAAVGFLFTLGLSVRLLIQGDNEERPYAYIGLPMAVGYFVIVVLAWAKKPLPRVTIRVICGVAAVLAGVALSILIATESVNSSSWSVYGGGPIILLILVVSGTIPASVRWIRRPRPPAN